jgi:N-acetylglucosamine kinase-like BadF-type ATPase
VLQEATNQALSFAGLACEQIAGAGFGIAGYDWPSQQPAMAKAIDSLGMKTPWTLVNDALIALAAGAEQGWGVAVVAGTSCNAWGRDREGKTGRMAGFSWLGEAAGAGELVLKAVQAVVKAWTMRGPSTRLTETFVERAGANDVGDLVEGLSQFRYALTAADAPLVFQIAASGDPVARDLLLWAGRELGDLAVGVIRQLDLQTQAFDVVLAGSFFKGSPVVTDAMQPVIHAIAPGARLVRMTAPPAVGGVLLGMEQASCDRAAIRQARTVLLTAH